MTHIVIQQKSVADGGAIEIVSGAVISALYNILHDENAIINSDDLKGDLQVSGTYQRYITDLENAYPGLHITALSYYLYFEDSVIGSYWANSTYGDGTGITITQVQSVNSWPRRDTDLNELAYNSRNGGKFAFYGDLTIRSFNELNQFTNITHIPSCAFKSSSLESINLDNITTLYPATFYYSNLSGVVNAPKLNTFAARDYNVIINNNTLNTDGFHFASTNITELNIGSDVIEGLKISSVPDGLVYGCRQLENIYGLSEVTTLGKESFKDCSSITNLSDLNPNVSIILDQCFNGAYSLVCIDLRNCTSLGEMAFLSCRNLLALDTNDVSLISLNDQYTIPATSIGNGCFLNTKLTGKTIILPNITKIGNSLFNTSNVKKVVATNVINVEKSAFWKCSSLESIELGSPISFGEDCFYNCNSLTSIKINGVELVDNLSAITEIGKRVFNKSRYINYTFPSNLSLPNLTGTLGEGSFANRTEITTVSNLGSIVKINGGVFNGCTNLSSITLPSTLREIYCTCFYDTALTLIVIPEGVTFAEFGQTRFPAGLFKYVEFPSTVTNVRNNFHRCLERDSDNSVIFVLKATTPPNLSYYGNEQDGSKSGAKKFSGIYVPDAALTAYQNAEGVWAYLEILDRLKPISQLQTDSPTYWQVYQSGLSQS